MSGNYVIPLYYQPGDLIAWQSRLHRPQLTPLYGYDLTTWWD